MIADSGLDALTRRDPDATYGGWPITFCGMPFSGLDLDSTFRYLERRRSTDSFAYVVTPNVDHTIRAWRTGEQTSRLYAEADLSLCDSRILALLARPLGVTLPLVTGSDLTSILFELVINPYERVTIIGGAPELISRLERRYELRNIKHYDPPMGFIHRRDEVGDTISFVERFPARFIFLALGSPQQERLAHILKRRGQASGTALCIGASLLFLTGDLKRAPDWMQQARLEWLHRLASEPRRLWRRYLLDGPKIFGLAARQVVEPSRAARARSQVSIVIPTYRREHLLPRLLERCIGQGGLGPQALEIIVVDNTPEATARWLVEKAAATSPVRIRYLHEAKPGISHARNRGVAEADGEFIAFIDDDELPSPEWLESLISTQRAYKADVVMGPVRPVFDRVPPRLRATYRRFFSKTSTAPTGTPISPPVPLRRARGAACYRPMASSNALLVKPRCFESATPFDPALGLTGGEDTLFFMQLWQRGRSIVWCREALVIERIPKERLTARFMLRRKFRDGQITSSTCLMLEPRAYPTLLWWMAVGVAQLGIGGVVGPVAVLVHRRIGLRALCMASTGLGKLLFFGPFRRASYGAKAGA